MDDRIIVFAAASAVGVCSTLFRPALVALLPSLAKTAGELIAANGATSTIESLGTLLGPLGAGVLVAFADTSVVFAASAAALLASAVLIARVSVPGHVPAPASAAGVEVWQGFKAIGAVPRARLLVGLIAAQTFVRGCLNVLIVVIAYQVLHTGATEVGYLAAAIGAGGLIGALGAVSLRGDRLAPPFAWALVCWGVPIMLIAPLRELAPVMRPACCNRRREQRRRCRGVHPHAAHRARRGADPGARRVVGPGNGCGRARLVRHACRPQPDRAPADAARSRRDSPAARPRLASAAARDRRGGCARLAARPRRARLALHPALARRQGTDRLASRRRWTSRPERS